MSSYVRHISVPEPSHFDAPLAPAQGPAPAATVFLNVYSATSKNL
jgi:hypothetical protein